MKKKLAIIAGSWVILTAGAAQAADAPYFSVAAGPAWLSDATLTEGGLSIDASFDTGYGITVAAGHSFDAVRAELELGYRKNGIDSFSGFGVSVPGSGDVTSTSVMANLYYDITPKARWSPFLGAGLGLARVEVDNAAVMGIVIGDAADTVFAWQLMAGIGCKLTERTTLDLSYRYFATSDPDFSGIEAEYGSHSVMAGVRVSF
jgi:opacity protein-like surface antigen